MVQVQISCNVMGTWLNLTKHLTEACGKYPQTFCGPISLYLVHDSEKIERILFVLQFPASVILEESFKMRDWKEMKNRLEMNFSISTLRKERNVVPSAEVAPIGRGFIFSFQKKISKAKPASCHGVRELLFLQCGVMKSGIYRFFTKKILRGRPE